MGTVLVVTSLFCLYISLSGGGEQSIETKKDLKDVTKYADLIGPESVKLDEDSETANVENNKKLLKQTIELVKIPMTAADDTQIVTILEKTGVFDVKKKDQDQNTQEEDKIKTDLKNNNLPTDPLTVGITKIIKNKIENSSTPDTSSKEIDDMLIKIMKDIEQQEELIDSINSNSAEDALEDIENTINVITHIDQALASGNKQADQKLIGLKNKLGMAEGQKKYLEEIIKAYEEAEKNGVFQTEGISSIKTRLEDTNQAIKNLETEIQQHEDKLKEEGIATEETTETSSGTKETEETVKDAKKVPTIKLNVVAGPTYSEEDEVCYYKVKAEVTGDPDPVITFSKDDSGGAWGKDIVQINLKDGGSYNLKATATNSEGSVTDSINLPWGCEVQDNTEDTSADNNETTEIKAPTIKIYVIDLDTTSSPWIAIYTVQAVVTGEPFPTIGWSTGTYDQDKDTVKVYVKSYSSNNGTISVTAWATNSEGTAQDSLTLVWEDVWTEKGY